LIGRGHTVVGRSEALLLLLGGQSSSRQLLVVNLLGDFDQLRAVESEERFVGERCILPAQIFGINPQNITSLAKSREV